MLGLQLLLELALMAVCLLAPGLFAVRRLRLAPLEKLCVSVGASVVLVYLASFVLFGLHAGRRWYFAVSLACAGLALAERRRFVQLLHSRPVRRALAGFLFLFLWSMSALALVRHYGGGRWFGDWLEHFQRSEVFLGRLPVNTVLFGGYTMPARPPLANLLASYFLAQAGNRFEVFQVGFLVLNLLVALPCLLLASTTIGGRGGKRNYSLVALLALNPFFLQNATYTWTKLAASFFVVLATALYLAGWRRRDGLHTVLAFASLAVGMLAHYMAGPYFVFFAGHALWRAARHRSLRWRELAAACGVSLVLLGTWVGWSVAIYGPAETLLSNTTFTEMERPSIGANVVRVAKNLAATLVPHPLRGVPIADLRQQSRPGFLRDWSFLVFQTNVIFAMGTAGGLLVVFLLCRAVRTDQTPWRRSMACFWLAFTASAFVIGVAVVGRSEDTGLAQICLAPLVLLGLTYLSTQLGRLPSAARAFLGVGLAIDFAIGIALHLNLENLSFDVAVPSVSPLAAAARGGPLSLAAFANWTVKRAFHLVFLGDHIGEWAAVLQLLLAAGAVALILGLTRAASQRQLEGDAGRPGVALPPGRTT